jgi:hypothetical protein
MSKLAHASALLAMTAVVAVPNTWGQGVPAAVRACASETDAAARLACFDREVARATASDSGAAAVPVPAAAPQLSPEERFGIRGELAREVEARTKVGNPDLERLTSKVTAMSRSPNGEMTVTIENGQVWAEREPGALRVRVGETVTIRTAALGSFLLTGTNGRAARVYRLR